MEGGVSDIRSGRFLAGLACAAAVFLLGGFFGVGKSLAGGKSLKLRFEVQLVDDRQIVDQ